jgi:hypothetical protein
VWIGECTQLQGFLPCLPISACPLLLLSSMSYHAAENGDGGSYHGGSSVLQTLWFD